MSKAEFDSRYHKQSRKDLVQRYHEESIERFSALYEALAKRRGSMGFGTTDVYYLYIEDVLRLHGRQLELFGGAAGVRDAGLIEAALARPQSGYYRDRIEEAAALWESLTMSHGFIDGNKRVGFAATYVFLRSNGLDITANANTTLELVIGRLDSGSFIKRCWSGGYGSTPLRFEVYSTLRLVGPTTSPFEVTAPERHRCLASGPGRRVPVLDDLPVFDAEQIDPG